MIVKVSLKSFSRISFFEAMELNGRIILVGETFKWEISFLITTYKMP